MVPTMDITDIIITKFTVHPLDGDELIIPTLNFTVYLWQCTDKYDS